MMGMCPLRMTFRVRKIRNGKPYLYDVTAYRDKDGRVRQHWAYVGTSDAIARQEVSDDTMADLSRVLLRTDLTAKDIQAVAKRHGLRLPRPDPKVIALENDRRQRKLSARFK